jgi:hypothetical protein
VATKASEMSIWVPVVTGVLTALSALGVGYLTLTANREQGERTAAATSQQIWLEQQKLSAAEKASFHSAAGDIILALLEENASMKWRAGFAKLHALYPDRVPEVLEAVRRAAEHSGNAAAKSVAEAVAKESETVERSQREWVIVFGGHSSIEEAKRHLAPATREYPGSAAIYLRSKSYRTTIGPFPSRITAESANIAVRARYRDDAYVVNLRRWCTRISSAAEYLECAVE